MYLGEGVVNKIVELECPVVRSTPSHKAQQRVTATILCALLVI